MLLKTCGDRDRPKSGNPVKDCGLGCFRAEMLRSLGGNNVALPG